MMGGRNVIVLEHHGTRIFQQLVAGKESPTDMRRPLESTLLQFVCCEAASAAQRSEAARILSKFQLQVSRVSLLLGQIFCTVYARQMSTRHPTPANRRSNHAQPTIVTVLSSERDAPHVSKHKQISHIMITSESLAPSASPSAQKNFQGASELSVAEKRLVINYPIISTPSYIHNSIASHSTIL